MPKTVFKSLQMQQRNQNFKYSCNPVVYTDCTGQFNTKYAAICGEKKRQRIGPHLYPFSTTDLTITKTSTFSDYRFFYRLLSHSAVYFKETMVLSLLNEPRHEKSCFFHI